jgi:DNA-binding transcriptional MerR regulator
MFTIGALSKRTGIKVETIRYYEGIGMLPQAPRTPSGRRLYDEAAVHRLAFVRHARELGFEIPAIRALLALQDTPEASCLEISRLATDQLAGVEGRIARLLRLRDELTRMIDACAGGSVADCRIVEALAHQSARIEPAVTS